MMMLMTVVPVMVSVRMTRMCDAKVNVRASLVSGWLNTAVHVAERNY